MKLHQRPLFLPMLAYIVGIIMACSFKVPLLPGLIAASIIILGASLVPQKSIPRPVLPLLLIVLLLGFVRASVYRQVPDGDVSQFADGKLVSLTGVVASDPETQPNRTDFVLKLSRIKTYYGEQETHGRAMVSLYRSKSEKDHPYIPSFGETIQIRGRLRTPLSPTNPMSPDYSEYLARRRIYCTLSSVSTGVSILQPAPWSMNWVASRFKSALEEKASGLLPPVHANLLLGILLGDYSSLPLNVQNDFMRTGTMHLLAASGYNCGLIVLIFGFLMIRLTAPRTYRHIALIGLLWLFALVTGGGPSIIRASIMVTVFLVGYLLRRPADMLNMIMLSCLIILGINPLSLYDVGFQLSFAAVAAIVLVMPLVESRLNAIFPLPIRRSSPSFVHALLWGARTIMIALAVSVAASIGTWPITAYYFNYLSTVSIIANAFTALLVLALTATGIAMLVSGFVLHSLAQVFAFGAKACTLVMLSIVTTLSNYTWSSISIQSPPAWILICYYLGVLGVLEYAYRRFEASKKLARHKRPCHAAPDHMAACPDSAK